MVSRNVVVTQIRSDPGSIPGISTFLFVLPERISSSFIESCLCETLFHNFFVFTTISCALLACAQRKALHWIM